MIYKEALSVLAGYGYPVGQARTALDDAHELGGKTLPDGLLITWDDDHGFRLHEERVR